MRVEWLGVRIKEIDMTLNKEKAANFFALCLIFFLGVVYMVNDLGSTKPKVNSAYTQEKKVFTLYVSAVCPHCANVEQFINTNKLSDKIVVKQKDVNVSIKNRNEIVKKAQECGFKVNENPIPIPFLWTGSTCITGDLDIIQFLIKQK